MKVENTAKVNEAGKTPNIVDRVSIKRVTKEGKSDFEDTITKELPFTIILNNEELVTLLCSPMDLKYLAIGFLLSEGLITNKDVIKKVVVDDRKGVAHVYTEEEEALDSELLFKRMITSGCGRGASFYSFADTDSKKIESSTSISASEIFALMKEFQHSSQVYKTTGGVHSAALCDNKRILVFKEDIGRHNAIDKIFGKCLLTDITTSDRVIITSGRVSSEIVLKIARRHIPILVSKSAPTSLGVRLANDLGITLIGFARGIRMNVYTYAERVSS